MRWTEQQLADHNAKHGMKPGGVTLVRPGDPMPVLLPTLAHGRLPKSKMNGTESDYAAHLELRKRAGEVLWFKFEPFKLRLAVGSYYKPDFGVLLADGLLEIHETKGFWREAARVRIKVAAELFPFRFVAITVVPKKNGGGWSEEAF